MVFAIIAIYQTQGYTGGISMTGGPALGLSPRLSAAIIASLFAGAGGLLPSLSNIAGTMIVQTSPSLPSTNLLLPLAIFFFIGVILNCAFNRQDWEIGRALVIGISAPGIITNLVNGAKLPNANTAPVSKPAVTGSLPMLKNPDGIWWFIAPAHAQDSTPTTPVPDAPPPQPNTFLRPLNVSVALGGVDRSSTLTIPVVTVIQSVDKTGNRSDIFKSTSAPFYNTINIPDNTVSLIFSVLAEKGNSFSAGASVPLPARYEVGGAVSPASKLQIVLHTIFNGESDIWWGFGASREASINSVEATIDGVTYQSASRPATCRVASNGVERYTSESVVTQTSGWRGGGYNQGAFCNDAINALKASTGNNSVYTIIGSSEQSRRDGFLNSHASYNYTCTIKVSSNPIFTVAPNPACN